MRAARIVVAVCLALAVSRAAADPPVVKYFFPAGAQRGTPTEIKVAGTLPKEGVRVWTSADDLTFEPTKKPDVFTVRIDADAPPGLRWARFVNDDGSSAAKAFLVGAVAEAKEVEPNDAVAQAQQIGSDAVVLNGMLEKSGDVDAYRVGLKAGQTFVASVDALNAFGSPIDAVLQVTDAAGFVLQQNQDERGFDPQLTFEPSHDGDYVVRVFGLASVPNSSIRFAGGEDAVYRLTLTTGPFVERAWPAAVDARTSADVLLRGWNLPAERPMALPAATDSGSLRRPVPQSFAGYASVVSLPLPTMVEGEAGFSQTPHLLETPILVSGQLSRPGERDAYLLKATKGQAFRVRVYAKAVGSPVDPVVHVYKPDGTLLIRLDDIARTDNDVDGLAAATVDGEYRLVVEDAFGGGGPRSFYVLDVRPSASDFGLSVAAAELAAVIGKPLEIAVTIDRGRGMAADIEVRLEGVPGVDDVTVVSPNKGAEAKKVTLKFTPTQAFSGPIRIVGRIAEPEASRTATAPLAAVVGARTDVLWLTASKTEFKPPPPTKKK